MLFFHPAIFNHLADFVKVFTVLFYGVLTWIEGEELNFSGILPKYIPQENPSEFIEWATEQYNGGDVDLRNTDPREIWTKGEKANE
jgi:hypothetical protein